MLDGFDVPRPLLRVLTPGSDVLVCAMKCAVVRVEE